MENFDPIFTLIANQPNISLNTNILETGLINIFLLLVILIYTGQDFLGSLLEQRKTTIINGVQDAEERLSEAQKRLDEAQNQLNQANFIITEIKEQTLITKKKLLEFETLQAKKDLIVRFDRALASFKSKERQLFVEIKQQIIGVVLERTIKRAQKTFSSSERANQLINDTINTLKGDLV